MPADPHVALRDPEAPGDVRGPERVRIGQGEDLAILRVQAFERLPDLVAALLRNQGAQGVVRGFRGRGAEAAEGFRLPARRTVPALADVDGGLEEKRGQRLELLDAAGLQGLDPAADRLLSHVFGVREVSDTAGGKIEKAFPKCLDVLCRSAGAALGLGGRTSPCFVPQCGPMLSKPGVAPTPQESP